MKFYKVKLHTKGKTREKILEDMKASEYFYLYEKVDEAIEQSIDFYNKLDSAIVIVAENFLNDDSNYAFMGNDEGYEEQIKEAIYISEQDEVYGTYINQRKEFEYDWANDQYCPDATLYFNKEQIEILEMIYETNIFEKMGESLKKELEIDCQEILDN